MKDYASMSDFEINKAVAIIEGHKCYYDNGSYTNGLDANRAVVKGNGIIGGFDPCNNPEDAWPVISENKISTMWMTSEKEWCAWSEGDLGEGAWYWESSPDYYFNCTSQLRAAMIVFLMMKEGE